jgi:hypothetical protein
VHFHLIGELAHIFHSLSAGAQSVGRKVDAWRLLSFTRDAAQHIICMFAFGIGSVVFALMAPRKSPSRVPCGATGDDLHVRVTCPLPPARAAKRIMAMNKSAVAIDHPVILSDMQSANVTPLFINRAARALSHTRHQRVRERVRARELFLRGWKSPDLRERSVSAGWVGTPDPRARRCVLNNFLSADTWREKWPIAQIDSLLLSI